MNVCTRVVVSAAILFCASTTARAAGRVLFPAPLHITRELVDPVSQKTSVIDEYCVGNRMVSVSGSRTAIADYGRGELTEIDFNAGTYSVTKFEQIARLYEKRSPRATVAEGEKKRQVLRASSDRELTLSRGAIEAVLGIGYPYPPDDDGDALLGTLRSHERKVATNAAGETEVEEYHLPLEQVMRHEIGGEEIEARNVVLRVGHELPPVDAIAIPSGAKLVESKAVAAQRLLEELDRP